MVIQQSLEFLDHFTGRVATRSEAPGTEIGTFGILLSRANGSE